MIRLIAGSLTRVELTRVRKRAAAPSGGSRAVRRLRYESVWVPKLDAPGVTAEGLRDLLRSTAR